MQKMMTRVGAGVSKKAAINVELAWEAVKRADYSEAGKVAFDPNDFATVYNYLEACARKVGVI